MSQSSVRSSVRAPRQKDREWVLVPASDVPLTLESLEQACLRRLVRLLRDTILWPPDGFGTAWTLGDYNILIVETAVAPDACLYVQFWSEPEQALLSEVSSGEANAAAKPFIPSSAATGLRKMGYRKGGAARNFRRKFAEGNKGDVEGLARQVLRIFHDILDYRGATPLVAQVMRAERSSRALVHTMFTPEDLVTMLRRLGYRASLTKSGRHPHILANTDVFSFVAWPACPAEDGGGFHCLDLLTPVGLLTPENGARWMEIINDINGRSRVARAWVGENERVMMGTSLVCRPGITEEGIGAAIGGWERAVLAVLAEVEETGESLRRSGEVDLLRPEPSALLGGGRETVH